MADGVIDRRQPRTGAIDVLISQMLDPDYDAIALGVESTAAERGVSLSGETSVADVMDRLVAEAERGLRRFAGAGVR